MKIAIVGPSPVPFTMGGIENMMMGLYQTINQETAHQAELVKLPSKEHSFWELIENYYQFYSLDLRHFDLVISAKYPAWMVQHDNCIFYVAHRLRGLYDTYHLMNLPYEVKRGNEKIDRILDYMAETPSPENLDQFFSMLFELKENAGRAEETFFQFPGPFVRKLVHYMDNYAFSRPRNAKYCSISQTVKDRKEYFPQGAEVDVVYLPSAKKDYSAGEYKHIFMVSRLDAPKRIDMLIRAMKLVKSDVKLYIAGTGPERAKLEKLADGDPRIEFLGFVSDEDVERYYANSLVIPYFPYEEDYGLITVEAMMHRKPVITTVDSGGPTEFVHNDETGFVTAFNAKEIAEKIDYFACNPAEAKRMGENAYHAVKDITWKSVVANLLGDIEFSAVSKRKKITVTSTFSIYPPQGGGQARIYNLYRELAKRYDVQIVSYTNFDQPAFDGEIARGLREIRIPRERAHQEKMWKLEGKAKIALSDIAEITLGGETKAYRKALENSLQESELCVVSHPYLYPVVKKYLNGKPFVYEAHNVESVMKKGMLPESEVKGDLVQQVYDTEKECCEKSIFVMTCSEEDRQTLHTLYGTPLDKIVVVPNGVDTGSTPFIAPEQRRENKAALGLGNEKIGLFMGSWHGPNLDACEMIFKIAELCPDVKFMLMGSQCLYFKDRTDIPDNVAMLGLVSEEVKNRVFGAVDFALNPMLGGSGTNLKMFDYMSAGIPIISTEFGTRGIENKDVFILADTVEETAQAVDWFAMDGEQENRICRARTYVEETFDWSVISQTLIKQIRRVELRQPYDIAISLGAPCQVAEQLKRHGLRTFSGPFDWTVLESVDCLVKAINNRFENYFALENLENRGKHEHTWLMFDKQYKCLSVHDFPLVEEDHIFDAYPEFMEKMSRRIKRFYEKIEGSKKTLFVRMHAGYEETKKLSACLKELTHDNYTLIVVNETESYDLIEENWDIPHTYAVRVHQTPDMPWQGYDPHWDEILEGVSVKDSCKADAAPDPNIEPCG